MKLVLATIFCSLLSGAALADNSILLTGASDKSGSGALSLDVVTDGSAHSFTLIAKLPGVSDKSADLTKCVGNAPKGWQSTCAVLNGELRVAAFAGEGASPLPKGVFSVGSITVKGLSGKPETSLVEVGDQGGNPLPTTSSVNF